MIDSIRMKTEDFYFKFRSAGLIIKNNKVLVVEMDNNGFYCLPGGYVEIGETTEETIIREMLEETGKEAKIIKYLGMVENYFITKSLRRMHEVSCYYLMEFADENIPQEDFSLIENDKGYIVKLDFKWINIEEIDKYIIKPNFLKNLLKSNELEFKHLIFDELYD